MLVALAGALLAGALTTLAPCAFTLLPVVIAGSAAGGPAGPATSPTPPRTRALVVVAALALSVVVFTLLLRASTVLIGVPPSLWRWVSGVVLVALGLASLFPGLWDSVSTRSGLGHRSGAALSRATRRPGVLGAALTGAALGPVFTSCSPLYAYVVVTVIPAERARGLALLLAYVVGLAGVLLAVALGGQRVIGRLRGASDPHSRLRRGLGVVLVVVGVLVLTGLMQTLEIWALDHLPLPSL